MPTYRHCRLRFGSSRQSIQQANLALLCSQLIRRLPSPRRDGDSRAYIHGRYCKVWNSFTCLLGDIRSMDEPKGWRELQRKLLDETDPQRLIEIVDELMRVLEAHEKKVAARELRNAARRDETSPDSTV